MHLPQETTKAENQMPSWKEKAVDRAVYAYTQKQHQIHHRPEDQTAYDADGNRSRRSRILEIEAQEQLNEYEES